MKLLVLLCLVAIIATSCFGERQLQMSVVEVELVKIDTLKNFYTAEEKILTWRSTKMLDFITYAPISTDYTVGSRMMVMMKR